MKIPGGINYKINQLDLSINAVRLYNKDLYNKLRIYKEQIDDTEDNWDKMKKIANPYELVHSSNLKEKREKSISSYNPLSRSFFKLTEIIYKYDLLKNYNDKSINMVGIAEGPGGFLESIYINRQKYNNNIRNDINNNIKNYNIRNNNVKYDSITGITLYPNNRYIPNWNKLNEKFRNINTLYGNIYEKDTINNISLKYDKNKCDLVTADGGFDYSVDFNNQELNSSKIILAEIVLCLKIQKKGGTFIIKFFDFFNSITIKLLYIIYMNYQDIEIFKPLTSRPANSEKYIVAQGFKGVDDELLSSLEELLYKWTNNKDHFDITGLNIDKKFYDFIGNYNIDFVENQLKYIKTTLNYINNLSKEEYKKIIFSQVENALEWVKKHEMEINKKSKNYIKFNYHQITAG
jgi:23S rRNA U2552 (ribose-2'-O)-methylase RlmE/FtsJ